MVDIKALRSDLAKMADGVWVDWDWGARLLVGSADNRAFIDEYTALLEAHHKGVRTGRLTPVEQWRIGAHAIARHILRGWSGLEENGSPLTYTVERGEAMLADPALAEMLSVVMLAANDRARYRVGLREDAKGN